ncbi:hypothetical protein POLEWNIK_00600 [Brevundimonas phage vB_BpoS-Polewnik]|nr:hypothetical protein POLEWNIK_00600 [Brevundimonas phage vB_BpoS-Polewnik]
MTDVTNWIGLGLTALGMSLGGMAYVQTKLEKLREDTERKREEQKKELEERHRTDLSRVEKAVDEERTERRRELDKMEKALEGFADVASAVISMGKSVEHLAERFTDHQRNTEKSLEEIKAQIKTPRPRARTVKKG